MTGSNSIDSIMVMKFGGTSVQNEESRRHVIKHICRNVESGKKVVAVVSAMGRKGDPYATDTLISLLKDVGEPVNPAELDSVMSIGEKDFAKASRCCKKIFSILGLQMNKH